MLIFYLLLQFIFKVEINATCIIISSFHYNKLSESQNGKMANHNMISEIYDNTI